MSRLKRRTFLGATLGSAGAALGQDQPTAVDLKVIAKDTGKLPWKEEMDKKLLRNYLVKNLVRDAGTGMEILLVRYPAGYVTPLHTHPCAHGMYVLEGVLVTHEGRYGPGNFVWFPEGLRMKHGASAEQGVTVLFVTNKPFEIQYV